LNFLFISLTRKWIFNRTYSQLYIEFDFRYLQLKHSELVIFFVKDNLSYQESKIYVVVTSLVVSKRDFYLRAIIKVGNYL